MPIVVKTSMKLFYLTLLIYYVHANHQERYHCDHELIAQGGLLIKPSDNGFPKNPPKISLGNKKGGYLV